MKKALIVFILSYAVVFYFINENYLPVTNTNDLSSSQSGETLKMIKVRNNVQQDSKSDTLFLKNPELRNSYQLR